MHIQPTNHLSSISQSQLNSAQVKSDVSEGIRTPVDQLDFSVEAQMMLNSTNGDIRADRVADIRMQIASGRYETPEKIEYAVERLLDQFA